MTTSTPTKRYEYKIVQVKDDGTRYLSDKEYEEKTLQMFNELGAEGWRLVDQIAHELHCYPRWLLMREVV